MNFLVSQYIQKLTFALCCSLLRMQKHYVLINNVPILIKKSFIAKKNANHHLTSRVATNLQLVKHAVSVKHDEVQSNDTRCVYIDSELRKTSVKEMALKQGLDGWQGK